MKTEKKDKRGEISCPRHFGHFSKPTVHLTSFTTTKSSPFPCLSGGAPRALLVLDIYVSYTLQRDKEHSFWSLFSRGGRTKSGGGRATDG